jgi:hypothetical protein
MEKTSAEQVKYESPPFGGDVWCLRYDGGRLPVIGVVCLPRRYDADDQN